MIIGITGSAGSGKSTIARQYKGYKIIDVDKLAHRLLDKKKKELVKAFGKEIIKNNIINRKALGNIVFSNKTKLNRLNKIIHPALTKEVIKLTRKYKDVIIDAALLRQLDLHKACDTIILVRCKKQVQIERLLKKTSYNKTQLNNMITQQNKSLKMLKPDVMIRNGY